MQSNCAFLRLELYTPFNYKAIAVFIVIIINCTQLGLRVFLNARFEVLAVLLLRLKSSETLCYVGK
jgi:hypothetical protein